MTRNLLAVLALILWSFDLIAQDRYEGIVHDLGTRENIGDVSITPSHFDTTVFSNANGEYGLELSPFVRLQETTHVFYSVSNRTVYLSTTEAATVALYGLNGSILFEQKLMGKQDVQIPLQKQGYYFLLVNSPTENARFYLYSDAQLMYQIKDDDVYSFTQPWDSSVLFSKPGYYSRRMDAEDLYQPSQVGLLSIAYDSLDYFQEMIRHEAFEMLHSSPPTSNFGEVQSVKILLNFETDEIYYINTKKYNSHLKFAQAIFGYDKGSLTFFRTQYGDLPERYLHLFTINYHENIDKYIFQFSPYNVIDCADIKLAYDKLLETSFFGDKLYFYTNNPDWQKCTGIRKISAEEIFLGQNYQALNLEESYGYLRKVDIDDLDKTHLGRHDILLVNSIPNSLSVVSGVITTEFQTPLSHINVLSHNRKTPNMGLRDGWDNPKLDTLIGELIYLKVESDSFIVRNATLTEANAFWNEREPQTPITLTKDVETQGLVNLAEQDITSVKTIGGKSANFAELINLKRIPVPENNFAIPFYYYDQHLKRTGLDTFVSNMISDSAFLANWVVKEAKLEELRARIASSPIDPALVALVLAKIDNFDEFESYRFRSSTNAEDIEGFNGAGLYDSYSAKKDHQTKTIENAIRKVWASAWNLRAFDERAYFKIDQNSIAMGILVHRSFPDEDANGVVITKNLYNVNHGFTFNVQFKEISIVQPEPGIIHDQILVYTFNLQGQSYTIDYLSKSNVPELNGKTVLTDNELYELSDYCSIIKKHYYNNIQQNCNCEYEDFAVDLELKVDSQVKQRKIYIKQARIF